MKWRGESYGRWSHIFIKIYSPKLHLNTIFKAQKWCNPSLTQVCFRNMVWNSQRVCGYKVNGGCNLVSPVPVGYKQVHSRAGSTGQCCSGELQPLSSPRGPWFNFQMLKGLWVWSSMSSQLLSSTPLSLGFPPRFGLMVPGRTLEFSSMVWRISQGLYEKWCLWRRGSAYNVHICSSIDSNSRERCSFLSLRSLVVSIRPNYFCFSLAFL